MEKLFSKFAPLTFRLISTLCGVQEGEHAGNHAYQSYLGIEKVTIDSADELASMRQGWAEDDVWQDKIELRMDAGTALVVKGPEVDLSQLELQIPVDQDVRNEVGLGRRRYRGTRN